MGDLRRNRSSTPPQHRPRPPRGIDSMPAGHIAATSGILDMMVCAWLSINLLHQGFFWIAADGRGSSTWANAEAQLPGTLGARSQYCRQRRQKDSAIMRMIRNHRQSYPLVTSDSAVRSFSAARQGLRDRAIGHTCQCAPATDCSRICQTLIAWIPTK